MCFKVSGRLLSALEPMMRAYHSYAYDLDQAYKTRQRNWNCTLCCIYEVSFVDDCQLGNQTRLTGNRGYMAVSPKPKQRTAERVAFCAWVISVDAGQKVNITWHHVTSGTVGVRDSTIGIGEETGALGQTEGLKGGVLMWPRRCFFSLRFVESGGEEYIHQRCRPHPGEGAIYLSKTNQVQIQVRTNPKELKGATDNDPIVSWRPYVLFYQGKDKGNFSVNVSMA